MDAITSNDPQLVEELSNQLVAGLTKGGATPCIAFQINSNVFGSVVELLSGIQIKDNQSISIKLRFDFAFDPK